MHAAGATVLLTSEPFFYPQREFVIVFTLLGYGPREKKEGSSTFFVTVEKEICNPNLHWVSR